MVVIDVDNENKIKKPVLAIVCYFSVFAGIREKPALEPAIYQHLMSV